jgi:hypothetical protein
MKVTGRRLLAALAIGAVIGLSIFGVMVYRAVTIETADPDGAAQRFATLRATLPPGPPVLVLDEAGHVARRAPARAAPGPIRRLSVRAYDAGAQRLVSAEVPFWFLELKGPAARYALRDTGLDLDRLRLTPADLTPYGPAIVIDHTRPNGDRLLVWMD